MSDADALPILPCAACTQGATRVLTLTIGYIVAASVPLCDRHAGAVERNEWGLSVYTDGTTTVIHGRNHHP